MSGLLLLMAKGAQLCNMMIAIQKKKEREQDKKKRQTTNKSNKHTQTNTQVLLPIALHATVVRT